jgi:hypothetical protein
MPDRSVEVEEAVQVIDSIAASRRFFIAFGGPPRTTGRSFGRGSVSVPSVSEPSPVPSAPGVK